MTTVDLTQRFPTLTPHEMLAGFVPSRRFEEARFDNYLPNPAFESHAGPQGPRVARNRAHLVTGRLRRDKQGLMRTQRHRLIGAEHLDLIV